MRVFVAGGAGAIGVRLVPQLLARGHHVTATTRSEDKARRLRALGAAAVALDGLDAAAVTGAVARAEPDVVVHEMTALAGKADIKRFDRWFAATNELRTLGTEHLLAAAESAGVGRFVAQSYTGWTNARTGPPVKAEDDPLEADPPKAQRRSPRSASSSTP
jgi:nucleoside-diphosphate-sugar epimerase